MNIPIFSTDHTLDLLNGGQRAGGLLKAALIFYDKVAILFPNELPDSVVDIVCAGSSLKPETVKNSVQTIEELGFDFEDFLWPDIFFDFMSKYMTKDNSSLQIKRLKEEIDNIKSNLGKETEDLIFHPVLKLYASLKLDMPYHGTYEEIESISRFFDQDESASRFTVNRELEVTLPPLEDVPFESVFEFRSSPYRDEFRNFLYHHQMRQSPADEIREKIEAGLWAAIGKYKPSSNGSLWSRSIAAAPVPSGIPFPNPYGVYKEWQEGKKEKKLFRNYGWLWFIQEVREKATLQLNESE